MRGAAEPRLEGLIEHLAEGRVRVDHHREVLQRRSGLDGVGALLDEVGGVQADDVHRDDLVGILLEDDMILSLSGLHCVSVSTSKVS